jgi:hypothetical protein
MADLVELVLRLVDHVSVRSFLHSTHGDTAHDET